MRTQVLLAMTFSTFMTFTSPAVAVVLDVIDNNSSISIDTNSQDGLFTWNVDGVSHLSREWFWLRTSSDTQESSLDTLSLSSAATSGNTATLSYNGTGFDVDLEYTLNGGANGSGASQIREDISLINTSGAPLTISLFSLSDFDLDGTSLDQQASGDAIGITQGDGLVVANVRPSLAGQAFQIALFDDLIDSFNDSGLTNLDNSGSPTGLGDLQFAFQHNFTIPNGGNADLTLLKDISAVPEPGTIGLFVSGIFLLLIQRRFQRKAVC
ncbi:MAG: PEP-CTERM sorting domain-containing protein [Deltaproteobacteria bacterium]|nr:PEP-CTERM sorting domain-containing protein [Deltaproteobacteria bacterium]